MHDASSPTRLERLVLDLAEFRPRALIFDLDGTLTDNMGLHAEAFAIFAERHGLPPLTMADRHRLDGKRNSEIFPVLFGRTFTRDELLVLEDEKESLYRELSRGRLRAVAGAASLMDRASAVGVHVAVATSAPAANVEHTLRELGMESLGDVVVRGDQVARGKPFPDVFLEAARRLSVEPAECLAFEDAPMGVEAAVRAGMACVAVSTSFEAEVLRRAAVPPHEVVADFDHFLTTFGHVLAARTPAP